MWGRGPYLNLIQLQRHLMSTSLRYWTHLIFHYCVPISNSLTARI